MNKPSCLCKNASGCTHRVVRDVEQWDRISFDAGVCFGKACVRDTRVRVIDVLGWLAAGMSRSEILDGYPYIEDKDITASLEFAQMLVDQLRAPAPKIPINYD